MIDVKLISHWWESLQNLLKVHPVPTLGQRGGQDHESEKIKGKDGGVIVKIRKKVRKGY